MGKAEGSCDGPCEERPLFELKQYISGDEEKQMAFREKWRWNPGIQSRKTTNQA